MLQPRLGNPPQSSDRFSSQFSHLPLLREPLPSSSSPPNLHQPNHNQTSTPIDELPNFPLFGGSLSSSRPRTSPPSSSEPAPEPTSSSSGTNKRKATMTLEEKREDELTWKSIAESQRLAAEGWKKLADEWKVLVDRYKGELDDAKHDMKEWQVKAENYKEERDEAWKELEDYGHR